MKLTHKLLLSVFILSLLFVSCKKDNTGSGKNPDASGVQTWIEKSLETYYLWNSDVKNKSRDYNKNYKDFFNSLLSTNRDDGKHNSSQSYFYSTIEKLDNTRANSSGIYENTLGFDFALTAPAVDLGDGTVSQKVYATIYYVLPGSPAAAADMKRGDNIGSIDGEEMTFDNYERLYPKILREVYGVTAQPVTVTWYRPEDTGKKAEDVYGNIYPVSKQNLMGTTRLVPATVENNPLFERETFNIDGKKVAYLVYNAFETGGDSHVYDDQLKEELISFGKVDELILDLRYNGGGYVSSCQLLSSMIVDETKLGTPFQKMLYNSSLGNRTINFLNTNEMSSSGYGAGAGVNLNLPKIYVIATGTSASASEALIHCLRGAGTEVIHIGEQTEGKNVGMSLIESTDSKNIDFGGDRYEMWPVTFYLSDCNDMRYTSAGLKPDFIYDEFYNVELKEFGDPEEVYLSYALYHIENESFPPTLGTNNFGSRNVLKMENQSTKIRKFHSLKKPGLLDYGL